MYNIYQIKTSMYNVHVTMIYVCYMYDLYDRWGRYFKFINMKIFEISLLRALSVYHHLKDKCAQYSYTVSSLYTSYKASIWKLDFPP